MTWKPNYSGWDSDNGEGLEAIEPTSVPTSSVPQPKEPSTEVPTPEDWKERMEKMRRIRRTPAPAFATAQPVPINWINWGQRIVIAILILSICWLIYRGEAGSTVMEKAAIQLDFTKMDRAANQARAAVFEQVADKAKDFKDLQALVDWQDEQLRAARLKAYQPWVDLLTQTLDEDRYDPQVAEKIFRAAARASNSQ